MILLALLLSVTSAGGAPGFTVETGLEPPVVFEREARAAWRDEAATWTRVSGKMPLAPPRISIVADPQLNRAQAGHSELGRISLRPHGGVDLDQRSLMALRHEVAHQLLFAACPASSQDRLFHEAFALSVSDELQEWSADGYASVGVSLASLKGGLDLDTRAGRKALARVIANAPARGPLSDPLAARVRRCADGAAWVPMSLEELAGPAPSEGDAWVVVSRHSGEVLEAEGDAEVPLPFGSTLKPFILAGAGGVGPRLLPRATPEWACGGDHRREMDARTAVLLSCNGYFLDWAAETPGVVKMGAYGPILSALGLGRVPADASEAIGLRPTLKLSPLAMAQAYRVLADASPDVVQTLRANGVSGTLSGLDASGRLAGVALKTGTVRDAGSHPNLGWIVAVDEDRVMVLVRHGRMPRSFADELADRRDRWKTRAQDSKAEVQILGLVLPAEIEARCSGLGLQVGVDGPRLLDASRFSSLQSLSKGGAVLCLGAPWLVRFPGGEEGGRPYAGSIAWSPPPPLRTEDPAVSERNRRAREGSSFVLRTRMASYVAGVLEAEDATLSGEARAAVIAAVVANAHHSRHAPRPICDTTHCQAFKGTQHPRPGDGLAIDQVSQASSDWRPFSQGGDEPWSEGRPLAEVSRVLGGTAIELRFAGGEVQFTVRRSEGEAVFDDQGRLSCELVRGPLKLPSCPRQASVDKGVVHFEGVGRGHGEGLQLEALKRSGQLRDEMVQSAY